MIPHNRPWITEEDRAAVDAVLRSGWIAQGREVELLEADFVRFYGRGGACAVSSGTAALFLALKALGIAAGAKVAIPTYACSALLNAIYMAGGVPKVVDVLPDTFCLSPDALTHQAPDAAYVIAVHTYGAPADIAALKQPKHKLIEDCCQSLGGENIEGLLGSGSDAAVFSFYATKIITGGQGGMVWANDRSVSETAKDYRQFDCRENYEPRFNLQMTDFQAAMIRSQMNRLQAIRERRKKIAKAYLEVLPQGLMTQSSVADAEHMPYRFVVLAPDLHSREAFRAHLTKKNIGCTIPLERYELLHRYLREDVNKFPNAEHIVDKSLSLPIHSALTDDEVEYIIAAIAKFKL